MYSNENRVYDIIDKKASSNVLLQGLTGIMGFPFTLIADVGTIFTHNGPMINEIRKVYGHSPVGKEAIAAFLSGCRQELVSDIVVDKVLGNMPVIGMPANMIAAKSMTWRIGIVVGMLSARGEEINAENVKNATAVVRRMFPAQKSVVFKKPSCQVVSKLLDVVEDISTDDMDQRMLNILNSIAC